MKASYDDIKSRIDEEPSWYDFNGVPRYGKFTPSAVPNIYTGQVALLRIACQACGQHFDVEIHTPTWPPDVMIRPKEWHYGDPPRHNCPGGGDTMNCDDLYVLESWHRDRGGQWVRVPEEEGPIT